jgi:ubiquinone/menaquinone biosynthesis C-methylase UbiE
MHRVDPEGVEVQALAELAPVDGLRVLELGCGEGRLTFEISATAKSVFAVDPDEERLNAARAALPAGLADKVELAVADATEVDSSHGEFDLALFSWSL